MIFYGVQCSNTTQDPTHDGGQWIKGDKNMETIQQLAKEYAETVKSGTFQDLANFAKNHKENFTEIHKQYEAMQKAEAEKKKQEETERKREQANKYGMLRIDANRIADVTIEILKKYNGKRYGEKTKEKITDEINQFANIKLGKYRAYISKNNYSLPTLNVFRVGNYSNNAMIQLDFLTEENKIKQEPIAYKLEEYNGGNLFDRMCEIKLELSKTLKDIKPLIEELNELHRKTNQGKYFSLYEFERCLD